MLVPFTQCRSGAGLSWLYVWAYSVLLSVRSYDGSVYTMEIGNCYKSRLLPPQAVRIQLCCRYNCRIHADQLDLFFKRQAGKPKTLLCPHCRTKGGVTGTSHLELIIFGTHTIYSGFIVMYLRLKLRVKVLQVYQAFQVYFFFLPVHGAA